MQEVSKAVCLVFILAHSSETDFSFLFGSLPCSDPVMFQMSAKTPPLFITYEVQLAWLCPDLNLSVCVCVGGWGVGRGELSKI